MNRWNEMLRERHRKPRERLGDLKWIIREGNPAHLEHALQERWVHSEQDLQLLADYAAEAEATPEMRTLLLSALQRCRAEREDSANDRLALDADDARLWEFVPHGDGICLTEYLGCDRRVEIPSSVDGKDVRALSEDLFSVDEARSMAAAEHARRIASIKVPGCVRIVPRGFGGHLPALERVELADGIVKVEEYAFMSAHRLREIILPQSLRAINDAAFAFCRAVDKLQGLHNGVRLHDDAFKYTGNGEGVEHIGAAAFACCFDLRTVHFPSTLQRIDLHAFQYCRALRELSGLPEDVHVGSDAFREAERPRSANGLVIIGDRVCNAVNTDPMDTIAIDEDLHVSADALRSMPPIVFRKGSALPAAPPDIPYDCGVGDTVLLGQFPRDTSLRMEPREWICICRDSGHALLMTKQIIASLSSDALFCRPRLVLSDWLNKAFAPTALSPAVRSRLGCDALFIPTAADVEEFLPKEADRTCGETYYASAQRTSPFSSSGRQPSWVTDTRWGSSLVVVDSTYGMLRQDNAADLESDYPSDDGAPFGIRPWLWIETASVYVAAAGSKQPAVRSCSVVETTKANRVSIDKHLPTHSAARALISSSRAFPDYAPLCTRVGSSLTASIFIL